MALYRPPIRPQPRFSRTNVGHMGDIFKNWSHAGDITDTKAEQHVNTTNICIILSPAYLCLAVSSKKNRDSPALNPSSLPSSCAPKLTSGC